MRTQKQVARKSRLTVTISQSLHKALERERWTRKAKSMSYLIESLAWEALQKKEKSDGDHNQNWRD